MKFWLSLFLTASLGFIAGKYFPWWSVAIAAFIIGFYFEQSAGFSFLSGFLAIFLLWGVLAFTIDMNNGQLLSGKVSELFSVQKLPYGLIIITALVGGIIGGLSSMTGKYLRTITKK